MRLRRFAAWLIAGACASQAWAQTTTRVSVDSVGTEANGPSFYPSISAGGRYVAFISYANNFVANDSNGYPDVFIHDRQTGTTTRISVASDGTEGNGSSGNSSALGGPSISADDRFVAFWSEATNLVPSDTNGFPDIFLRDMQSDTTTRASVDSSGIQADSASYYPSVSGDGRFVAFMSSASNLVPGDTNGVSDIFVHDCQSGTTSRVSVDSGGAQGNSNSGYSANGELPLSISSDGRYVAFESYATNLVSGDTSGASDVFVHDLQTGVTTRVSVSSAGVQGDSYSGAPSMSSNGRFVAFVSPSSNLVPADTNGAWDLFVHDVLSGSTMRASVASNGAEITVGYGAFGGPSISADGRFVTFASDAPTLVMGDTNNYFDVFMHDSQTATTTRMSVDSGGAQANQNSGTFGAPSISSDGRFVALASNASNLVPVDQNGFVDVFVRDRGAASAFTHFCLGDGSGAFCPCGNSGGAGRGCQNSTGTGGALLTVSGFASLPVDTVQFISAGELPSAFSIVLQGDSITTPVNFGDGIRCTGGNLKRLYKRSASGGVLIVPQGADPSISARSAALGDAIPLGSTRDYQVYYRDANGTFCPAPVGATFNVSNAIAIAWGA